MSNGGVARYTRQVPGWLPADAEGQGVVARAEAASSGIETMTPEEFRGTIEGHYSELEVETARRRLDACRASLEADFGAELVARLYDHPHLLTFVTHLDEELEEDAAAYQALEWLKQHLGSAVADAFNAVNGIA